MCYGFLVKKCQTIFLIWFRNQIFLHTAINVLYFQITTNLAQKGQAYQSLLVVINILNKKHYKNK